MPTFIGFLPLLIVLLSTTVHSQLLPDIIPAVTVSAADQAVALQPTKTLCVSFFLFEAPVQIPPTTTFYAPTTTETQSLDCGGCLLEIQVHVPGGIHVCTSTPSEENATLQNAYN